MDAKAELTRIQKELANKREDARRLGRCLVELGKLLQRDDPDRWLFGKQTQESTELHSTEQLMPELVAALDRQELEQLLEEIRALRRRQAQLEKRLDKTS